MALKVKDDGGPAFPEAGHYSGMSLRDWFAGQALAGNCAALGMSGLRVDPRSAVARAYEFADAMLAERSKP